MILKLMKIQETPDDIKNMFLFRYFFNKFEIEFTEIPFFSKNQNILFNQIHESLHYTHKDLKQRYEIDIDNSGTTLCSGIVFGNTLYIINVGDSRAILGTYYTIYNKWKTTQLSIDHKPKSPNENKRIIACSGRVDKFKNEFGEEYGVYRVFRKEFDSIYPGLAISRSIGDEDAKKLGVVYEPEVFRYELKSQDKILIIGSDGLWEQLSNEEAIKIVGNCMNNNIKSDEAASILVDKAKKKMTNNKTGPKTITINSDGDDDFDLNDSKEEKRRYIDNITCIVIYFDIK
jgi:serine/threonine protein phosphatase PrpC